MLVKIQLVWLLVFLNQYTKGQNQHGDFSDYKSFDKLGGYDVGAILFITKKEFSSPIVELKETRLFETYETSSVDSYEYNYKRLNEMRRFFSSAHYRLVSVKFNGYRGNRVLIKGGTSLIRASIEKLNIGEIEDLNYAVKLFRRPKVITEVIQFDSATYSFAFNEKLSRDVVLRNSLPANHSNPEIDEENLNVKYGRQNLFYKDQKLSSYEYRTLKDLLFGQRKYESFFIEPVFGGISLMGGAKALKIDHKAFYGAALNLDVRNADYNLFGASIRYFTYGFKTNSFFSTFRNDYNGVVENSFKVDAWQGVLKFYIWNLNSPFKVYLAASYTRNFIKLNSVQSDYLNVVEEDVLRSSDNRINSFKGFGGGLGFTYLIGVRSMTDPTPHRWSISLETLIYNTYIINHSYTFNLYGNANVERSLIKVLNLQLQLTVGFKLFRW